MSESTRYTLFGVLFGLLFPIGSMAFLHVAEGHAHALSLHGMTEHVLMVHAGNPLIWVIDTAPVFLGLFARFAGVRQDRIRRLMSGLEREVVEKTESLRRALAEAQKANETIAYMAEHDSLTGLLTRRRFQQEMEHWMEHARRYHRTAALMFLDVDYLKDVNDALGHTAGDNYLRQVADILRRTFRSTDFLCRWGGDEFAVLLPEAGETEATVAASKLIGAMHGERLTVGYVSRPVSASIGLALAPTHTTVAAELVRFADAAMYAAKEAGRGRWCLYPGCAAEAPAEIAD